MRPPPRQTIAEWADANRVLSSEASAEPGKWRTSRAEFQRGIMEAMTDPLVRKVVVRKAAQVGATEMMNNIIGYFMDRDPSTMMVIQPTVQMGETWSKKRLAPMLRDTPVLRGKIADAKSRNSDNTILEKGFPGGYITIVGANAPSSLASRPIRLVLADEVDRYPASAGTEGDPLTLAMRRQATFWNAKTYVCSTPVDKATSVIEREYQAGDKRRFLVPCPDCGLEQPLVWENIVWDKTADGHRPETAAYLCRDCGCLWNDAKRWQAIGRGRWEATAPFTGTASFDLTGFLSPWLTLEEIVRDFLQSKDWAPKLKTWVNTVKGEPWEERGEASSAGELAQRAEPYDEHSLPEGVRLVTAGVDTQDDRLEYSLIGWGDGEEAWLIRHEVLNGDPGHLEVWAELDAALKDAICRTEDGRRLRVRAACVDSGGHHGAMVLSFARARESRRIYATKGIGNDHRGSRPIWGKSLLKTKNAGDRLWAVGVDTAKDGLQARLRIVPGDEPMPKAVHFPTTGLSSDYFDQLTSEMVVTELTREGRLQRKWKPKPGQKRNEALDCFILAEAAMLSLPTRLMRSSYSGVPVTEADGAVAEAPVTETETEPPAPLSRPRRRKQWGAYS
ncbi:phage terminase large subunit family protein [Paracoccus yeei]|nr:phage terminase large subunit family protein [Paracoccus yeei]AZV00450.1 terminase large subunit [Paracoccus phage vB_PyeM_Pyei1]